MPIVSEREPAIALAAKILSRSRTKTAKECALAALSQIYDVVEGDGIWSGSDTAICLGYRDQGEEDDEDLLDEIAEDIAYEAEKLVAARRKKKTLQNA